VVAAGEEVGREQPAKVSAFDQILAILRQRTGVDFTHYRRATMQRRVRRRMLVRRFESPQAYADHLQAHAIECDELFNEILIHLTGFFREAGVYRAFRKKLFPALLKEKTAEEPLRIWVPGCSTGQEVYSIAIALVEFMGDRKQHHPVQIFGTDIHDAALEKARAGVYPDAIESDVSAERLRRYFHKTADGYRINNDIRESCIFARQNLVVDPAFSKLDLISCRDVLVYLDATLQRKVVPRFHYALNSNGFLVLGASETVGSFSDLFSLLDRNVPIYTKKAVRSRSAVHFGRASHSPVASSRLQPPAPPTPADPSLSDLRKSADRILLTHYCPASVIINRHLEVLQSRGAIGLFLEHTGGEGRPNLLAIAREGLIPRLRAAVATATKRNVRVIRRGVRVSQNGYSLETTVEVIPFCAPPSLEKFYLVLFLWNSESVKAKTEKTRRSGKHCAPRLAEIHELVRLNEELAASRELLQSTIAEQEATMHELRSANEEITSSNEELKSTNEELEIARVELQSTNEELTSLNDVLEHRNTELERINNDLHNVLNTVDVPLLVLGADLRIRHFTGAAARLCGLIPGDIGRPITDINLQLEGPDLSKAVLEVTDRLTTLEFGIKDRTGHRYSARVRPYKTSDDRSEGTVIAFVEIEPQPHNSETGLPVPHVQRYSGHRTTPRE
jgi:two-component system CheB/CheR fusion protein